jgi:transcriptional antiterminator RfaH
MNQKIEETKEAIADEASANKSAIAWYVVHTKPRQEVRALENLEKQGFTCFLPMMQAQKLRAQRVQLVTEPMFSRYLFIQLDDQTQNWAPIRSTLGVSKLVRFGTTPAKVPSALVNFLREAPSDVLRRMFEPGDSVLVANGPLKGLEGKYLAHDGETRAFVLIDLLGQPQRLRMTMDSLLAT